MWSLGLSSTRLSSPKERSNMRLHCRWACHGFSERSVWLWQWLLKCLIRWPQEQQHPQPRQKSCRARMVVDVGGDVRIGDPAKGIWLTAVAGLIELGSATSVTCQTTSSQIAHSALLPMRPQKGMSSGHHLSPARPMGSGPQGNQGGGDTPRDPSQALDH